jgi:glycosyltransferase involved in cell wall biosynthesis
MVSEMARCLFIDTTNLIAYAVRFDRVSGVQRVQLELLKFMLEKRSDIKTFNLLGENGSTLAGLVRQNTSDIAIMQGLREVFAVPGSKGEMREWRHLSFTQKVKATWEQLRSPKLKAGDVLFVPEAFGFTQVAAAAYKAIAAKGIKLVFLVHDLLPVTRPDLAVAGAQDAYLSNLQIPGCVITTSASNAADFEAARQMIPHVACSADVVIVNLAHEFPCAARNSVFEEPTERLEETLSGKRFILCVGTVEIRKNHAGLLQAWRALNDDAGSELPILVIAGRRGWNAEAALALLDDPPAAYRKELFFLEDPTDDELKWLYSHCDFTIYPSLFEGWGLPVGESLWFGKACAASQTSSIPEVGGGLCIYFDPRDAEDMKAAIRQLLDPSVRKIFEQKIRSADLRTWADVGRDLAAALLNISRTDGG